METGTITTSKLEPMEKNVHPLMPLPAVLKYDDGFLEINNAFRVGLAGHLEPRLERAATRLLDRITVLTGIPISHALTADFEEASLLIRVDKGTHIVQQAAEDESYRLEINIARAVIHGTTFYGALRGIETFLQLIHLGHGGFCVPAVRISDQPRYPWRGLLIDAVRHWIPPTVIKRNLEAMATVKLNVFHWHLTDDQGFRVESRRFPKLHQLGSNGFFYSQEEVREIVAFAADRGIRVLPEFDMPGHAGSWFVGYPELASAPGPYQIERGYGSQEATMDPSSEETYAFLSEFFAEMTTLFPDPFVHIGGDQVNGKQWQANSNIRAFMAKENLNDIHQLQTYFNRRLHTILQELDRQLVGWDPILHPNLPEGAVVQSVRGQQWLAEAVRQGYWAVAGSEYYLTQMRSAAYHYNRDPCGSEAASLTAEQQGLILGGETSIWTEVSDADNIDSRIWPRTAAIAERLWSPQNVTNIDDMYRRLEVHDQRLELTGVRHNSSPRRMLQRLTNYRSSEPLNILAKVVQPVSSGARKKSRVYSIDTPLNRLVDASHPESSTARQFSQMIKLFLNGRTNHSAYNDLKTQLKIWRGNHDRLGPEFKRPSLLSEVEPLSAMLSNVAEVGLQALKLLHNEGSLSSEDQSKHLELLEQATVPIAELKLMIVPGVKELVKAIPADA